jgi:hypothetical protein
LTLRRVVAETQPEVRSASTAADALGGNRFLLHAGSAASVSPRLAAMALLSSAPSYITRLAPSPAKATPGVLHHWTSIKSTAAAHSINSQSRARQAIRLVEISSFVENAPLKIGVIHFASATYVWHSPCISRYCRNVDSQIQQPIMSCQRSTTNGPVSSNPYYWRIRRDWRCLCRPLPSAGP